MGIFSTVLLPWMMTAHHNHRPTPQKNKQEEQEGNQIRLNLTDFWKKMSKKLVQRILTKKILQQGEQFYIILRIYVTNKIIFRNIHFWTIRKNH